MSLSDQNSSQLASTKADFIETNAVQVDLKGAVGKAANKGSSLQLTIQRLPLAVYREIAAHLQQLEGVSVTLMEQTSKDFDYLQSQVGGIELTFLGSSCFKDGGDRLVEILNHYAARFGPWEAA
ncbi:MAG: hypothetical protein AAGA67_00105 [Cyanobacteria bacterium P01_F01_bin.153]